MTDLRWIGCVAVVLLAGIPYGASAQSTADAYFHKAAQQYVADDVEAAQRTVEQGLAVAPSDPRLLALRKKLRQGTGPNRPQNQDSTSTESENQQQTDANPSSDEASKGGEQSSSKQNEASQPGNRNDSSKQNGAGAAESRPADQREQAETVKQGRGGRPVDSLSQAQAERLLRALEGQERQLLRQLRTRSSKRRTVEKDW
jgi:hypothetical protein